MHCIASGNVKWHSCYEKEYTVPQKLDIKPPACPLLGIDAKKKKKKMENKDSNRYLYANVHRSIIHNSNNVETTQMSSDRKMNK